MPGLLINPVAGSLSHAIEGDELKIMISGSSNFILL